MAALLAAIMAGLDLAPLPCGIADLEPDIVRVVPLPGDFIFDLWLPTHEDLSKAARIRAFLDIVADALLKEVPLRAWG